MLQDAPGACQISGHKHKALGSGEAKPAWAEDRGSPQFPKSKDLPKRHKWPCVCTCARKRRQRYRDGSGSRTEQPGFLKKTEQAGRSEERQRRNGKRRERARESLLNKLQCTEPNRIWVQTNYLKNKKVRDDQRVWNADQRRRNDQRVFLNSLIWLRHTLRP